MESDLDLLPFKENLPKSRSTRHHLSYRLETRIEDEFVSTACTMILTQEDSKVVKPYYLGIPGGQIILFDRDAFLPG